MKIENVKLSELKPLEKNVRKHGENQINELAKSVDQFDITRAMVIDEDNNILIGNGLYLALQRLGKTEVPCLRKIGLTEKQKKKLILSDNKVYSLGADDYSEIENFIKDIVEDGDYEIPGFDEDVLRQLTATVEEIEQSVGDYGKITDEIITNPEPPSVKPVPTPSNNDTAEQENESDTPEAPDVPPQETADTRRSVMCPNCGEVIYID